MIVRDESLTLARALDCAKAFADEIVVVDTGSTDNTVEIAARYTQKIYTFEWRDDFSAARNYAFEKATCDFVMWLDADDVITPESSEKIVELLSGEEFDMAFLPYVTLSADGAPEYFYYRERIFRRSLDFRFKGFVHEAVEPRGKRIFSQAQIIHKKLKSPAHMRNLSIYQRHIAAGETLDERAKFYYGRELLFNNMPREAAAVLEDFLNGNGWIENKIEACMNLCRAYIMSGDEPKALNSVLRSFLYAPPRAEACCTLGGYFFKKEEYSTATYWYERALACGGEYCGSGIGGNGNGDCGVTDCKSKTDGESETDGESDKGGKALEKIAKSGAFVNVDYGRFVPYIQLCVIYDRLGEPERANAFNELAGAIKPHSEIYLHNKRYFTEKLKKEV